MQRVTRSTAVAVLPAPPAGAGSPGYFSGGNSGTGTPATIPGYEWFNGVQEELLAVIESVGLTPSAADNTQLLQAITGIVAAASGVVLGDFTGANQSFAASGFQRLPGGFIVQHGQFTTSASGYTDLTFPITFANELLAISGNPSVSGTTGWISFNGSAKTPSKIPAAGIGLSAGAPIYIAVPMTYIAIGH